jgi:hypothetical protein
MDAKELEKKLVARRNNVKVIQEETSKILSKKIRITYLSP